MAPLPLPAGTPATIGPYRLDARLGRGGMGEVYRGYDARLDRPVALKRVHPGVGDPETALRRFQREARAAARLRHPSIVQVHDWVEADGEAWLVMELVEGVSLRELLRSGPLSAGRVLGLARDLLEGLAAAHDAGLVHRDLKAENVMVTAGSMAGRGRAERARILDFGLAKQAAGEEESRLSVEGKIVGTLSALAPEQVTGGELDGRTDLFALGSLLYEALSGVQPFVGRNAGETLNRICAHQPPNLRELRPELSPSLAALRRPPAAERPAAAAGVGARRARRARRGLRRRRFGQPGDAGGETTRRPPGRSGRSRRPRRPPPRRARPASPPSGIRCRAAAPGPRRPPAAACAGAGAGGKRRGAGAGRLWRPPCCWRGWPPFRYFGGLGDPGRTVYVVVPETRIEAPVQEAGPLAARAIHATLLQGLVDLQGIAAIEPPAGAAADDPRALARELAADELLTASLACDQHDCRVQLQRVAGADGRVLWVQSFTANPAELLPLSQALLAFLPSAYPENPRRRGVADLKVRPADYETYLRLFQRFLARDRGLSSEALVAELGRLGESSPSFLAAPLLEAHVSLQRFQESRGPADLERAERALARALALAPENPQVLMLAARAARQAGDLEAAAARLDEVRRLEPGNVDALLQQALLAERSGNAAKALELARQAAEQRPSTSLLLNVSDVFSRQGNVAAARGYIEEALERSPKSFGALSRLAQLELQHGAFARAAELYARLVERSPEETELTNLGTALMMLGRFDEAAARFVAVAEKSPSSPYAILSLADVEGLRGRGDEAARLYQRVVELVPGRPAAGKARLGQGPGPGPLGPPRGSGRRHAAGAEEAARQRLDRLRSRPGLRPGRRPLLGHLERPPRPRAGHRKKLVRPALLRPGPRFPRPFLKGKRDDRSFRAAATVLAEPGGFCHGSRGLCLARPGLRPFRGGLAPRGCFPRRLRRRGITTAALAPRRPLRHAVEIGIVFVAVRLAGFSARRLGRCWRSTFAGAWLAGFLRKMQLRSAPARLKHHSPDRPSRRRSASRRGGWPKSRRYSRLNCEALA